MADAFGMPSATGQQYMPQAQTFDGGIQGYSSAALTRPYELAIRRLVKRLSCSLHPVTGTLECESTTAVALESKVEEGK